MHFTDAQCEALLDLARGTIRRELGEADAPLPELGDPAYSAPAGCFISLHRAADHRLRGCLGQLIARMPLKDAVAEMSQAVLEDPRFVQNPVSRDELPGLQLEITVLSPLELAQNADDFDLLNHGIYLQCAGESGCFLPQVARETGWTRQQLLERLCTEKMGLPHDSWTRPDAKLYRFSATILGPAPFDNR